MNVDGGKAKVIMEAGKWIVKEVAKSIAIDVFKDLAREAVSWGNGENPKSHKDFSGSYYGGSDD